jgi:Domain of unknown function (DUF4118)
MMVPMRPADEREASTLVGLAVAAFGPIAVAAVLVPFRDDLDSANLALILVLVVVIAAILGGRRAGAVAAIMATLSFDFFLVRPYLSMEIESVDDIETALILLGVGLLVGQVASRGRRSRRGQEEAADAIARLHRVADLAATGAPIDDVVAAVTAELRSLLSLYDCWLEWRPFVYVMPRLERGGAINQAEHHWTEGGVVLSEDGVELPVLDHGNEIARLVLIGSPTVAVTLEQRVVAVALGDQLGLALALAGPAEQDRLAKQFRKE